MRRPILILLVPALMLVAAEAFGQWVFDPSINQPPGHSAQPTYRLPYLSTAPAPARPAPTVSASSPGSPSSSEWDQSGIIGRQDRDAAWHHEENMSGIYSYLKGLHDGSNAVRPGWGPYPPYPPYGPLMSKPPAKKQSKGNWRKP